MLREVIVLHHAFSSGVIQPSPVYGMRAIQHLKHYKCLMEPILQKVISMIYMQAILIFNPLFTHIPLAYKEIVYNFLNKLKSIVHVKQFKITAAVLVPCCILSMDAVWKLRKP